ncbi:F0F1 ATP synthase subunit A [Aquifex aeolicus]|uniref:ATP synthase subunit a n=1 Tax=Aquifex aeolicus (strain VF5) TaxID=224324 RepID=ATP6_AQUAE|nr:F0F1 ATP synthase subunit A [Aquifex aeolicus]O66566.1 RecName: Full=ATP synthase subunit a; AltName: Full=ATP synthase F0 sector subunit a; AltName: Full=F-ATPase subunit 6 [Aquifex aeolicus VF5]AAC06523.1 ATP synthase F0 subunit a [Aquifex aeolicus VF5]
MEYSHVVYALLAVALAIIFVLKGGKPSLKPTKYQALLEGYLRFVRNMLLENVGERGLKYVPLIAAIGLFVFFGNILGMVPGFEAPTANINTNLALALLVFFYYHFEGFRENGLAYLKHFMGPIPLMAPFFFVVEVISHIARPITLSLRLFANMKAGALLLLTLVSLVIKNPFTLVVSPVVLIFVIAIKFLAIFIQTYIFMILSVVYIAGAVAHEEH